MPTRRDDLPVEKVVSGGQTGVDRGALDSAIELGMVHGGWCPKGRRSEDGPIPKKYILQATDSSVYHQRTEQNVLDSDGTLILCRGLLRGGTQLTHTLAVEHDRPVIVVDLTGFPLTGYPDKNGQQHIKNVRAWLGRHAIVVLNVAGPRESQNSGIAALAQRFLTSVLAGD